jgi:hypothetical protein
MSVKSRVSKNKNKSKSKKISRMETIPEENDFHSALEENSISKYFDSQDSEPQESEPQEPKPEPKTEPKQQETQNKSKALEKGQKVNKPPNVTKVTKVYAPTVKTDPRVLGVGASKMVWLDKPHYKNVVVNALNSQIFNDKAIHEKIKLEQLEIKKASQLREFYFSNLMHSRFPHLLPRVYGLPEGLYHPTNRFRYAKDRCEPVVRDEALFHTMIKISDDLIDQGWVFLDMKPANLGLLNGKVVILDTDPESFYLIPKYENKEENAEEYKYYKNACRMIILLFCYNFVPSIPVKALHDYVHKTGLTERIFHATFDYLPLSRTIIAEYTNNWFIANHHPQIKLLPEKMFHPARFIIHYGNIPSRGIHALTRLNDILDYKS